MKKEVKLMLGDNMLSLKKLKDNSIDSVVTDPPYGISFMNKKWDYEVPSIDFWKEVYRVLKPGGHILSFGGTRTYHRMVINIEDAGFEIRDQIMWIYGSGFPKSHNIGKAVDRLNGKDIPKNKGFNVAGQGIALNSNRELRSDHPNYVKPKYENEYEGWGTALKPANEPICLARKPLSEKTIVENVIKWGTGAINVDGCRIATEDKLGRVVTAQKEKTSYSLHSETKEYNNSDDAGGRFPANILFDEVSSEMLDNQSGIPKGGVSRFFYVAKVGKKERNLGLDNFDNKERPGQNDTGLYSSSPYCIDCGKTINGTNNHSNCKEGLEYKPSTTITKNNHPTLKPINLMTYLCRLITPKGGTILDPFMGSGSSGISACLEEFNFIGMELDEDYFKIAEARIENYELYKNIIK